MTTVPGSTSVPIPTVQAGSTVTILNTAAQWDAAWRALPIGGDGNQSCRVDNDRLIFTSGDALSRDGKNTWAFNLITVRDRNGLHVARPDHPGARSPYQAMPDEANGDYHWLAPSMYYNRRLYDLALRVRGTGPETTVLGVDLAVFKVPANRDPIYLTKYAMPKQWNAAIIYDKIDNYVYWFGNSPQATDGWTGYDNYVARTRVDMLTDQHWEYWAGTRWSRTASLAKPFLRSAISGGTEIIYTVWHDIDGWHIVSRYGGGWGTLKGVPTISQWNNPHSLTSGRWTRRDLVSGIDPAAYSLWYHRNLKKITYNVPGQSSMTWIEYPR